MQWDVLACAALCALGATLGLIAVLSEMRYHIISPTRCPAYVVAALCLGVVLGLWIPRRVIRRHITHDPGNASKTPPTAFDDPVGSNLEFAAALAGGLIIIFALMWVALGGYAMLMEGYRGFLARRFAHPIWLTHLLLSGPMLTGLVVAGATGTTLLVALHGWYRLATQPRIHIARLWASILLGAFGAGLLVPRIDSATVLAGMAPLAMFLAGVIAVLRRSDAAGTSTPPPIQCGLTRDESLSLLTAGLAAVVVATACVLAIPPTGVTPRNLPLGVVTLAGAACAGLCVAYLILRLRLIVDLGATALLLGALALLLPFQRLFADPINIALVRLAVVTGCAAACVVLVGHRVERTHHSIQCSLSWVGRIVAAGFGLTLVLLPSAAGRWNPSTTAMIVALLAIAGAGLALILGSRTNVAMRLAGVLCIALLLVGMLRPERSPAAIYAVAQEKHRRDADATATPLAAAARQLVTANSFRTARVRPLPPSNAGAMTWKVDLTGSALDLVILESAAETNDQSVSRDWGRRLLARIGTRLAQGGRLLVELPTPTCVAEALNQFNPAAGNSYRTGYRLRIWNEADEYEALVFGGDIPALIERNQLESDFQISLDPLPAPPDTKR